MSERILQPNNIICEHKFSGVSLFPANFINSPKMKEKQLISVFKYPSTHRSGALGALEVTEMLRRDKGGIIGVF